MVVRLGERIKRVLTLPPSRVTAGQFILALLQTFKLCFLYIGSFSPLSLASISPNTDSTWHFNWLWIAFLASFLVEFNLNKVKVFKDFDFLYLSTN